MKVYPKIPRCDHPVVPDEFFDRSDHVLIEKYDGSSFRFVLFDDRYDDQYPDQVREAAGGNGSMVFGTRKAIRGSHDDDLETIDGALHRAVRALRRSVDPDALITIHDQYDGPVVFYAENLIYSTLDYGFETGSLPALVGFDAAPLTAFDTLTPSANPYEETHAAFLDFQTVCELFEELRQPSDADQVIALPQTVDWSGPIDPDDFAFPASSLNADVTVEGVVARNDDLGRRVKIVREAFKERNAEVFGPDPEKADSGTEYVVAKYCTPARIRKQVRTLVVEEGRDFSLALNEDLYPRVVRDIWFEEADNLLRLDQELVPNNLYGLVADRCITELRKMKINAELNDTDPLTIWSHLSE